MRLNKFLASAGVASRRGADALIEERRVTINGTIAAVGTDIDPEKDHIKVDGKLITAVAEHVYVLLYKPVGYICSSEDPQGRPRAVDLVKEHRGKRLFSVGRLDFNSEGLIILTNDGDFAAYAGHPRTGPMKTYQARVRGVPDARTVQRLKNGIVVEGEKMKLPFVKVIRSEKNSWLEIGLKEGKNRQVRRMLQAVGHPVVKLRRIRIGPLNISGMKPGQYRPLTDMEIIRIWPKK